MKVTWKEGRRTRVAEGTEESLKSHLAYLDALDIKWEEVGEENVDSQDDSE